MLNRTRFFVALSVGILGSPGLAQPLGSDFTYQGELANGGTPASGQFDLVFRLFDASTAGSQIGPTLCVNDLLVENGKFTASLDFGAVFGTQQRFVEVQVRDGSAGDCTTATGYVTLLPRQLVAATPAAQFATQANSSSTLGGQPRSFFQNATNLTSGTLPDARLSSNIARVDAVSNTFTGSITAPTFTGSLIGNASTATNATNANNATNLNNQPASFYLNATNINAGTLADARLSTNIPRLNAVSSTFTGGIAAPTFTGALNGNATTATTASNATNFGGQTPAFFQSASNLNTGTLADARLSSNVPLLNASNTFAGSSTFSGFASFNNSTTFSNAVTMQGIGGLNVQEDSGGTGQLRLQFISGQPTLRVAGLGPSSTAGLRIGTPGATTAFHITNAGDVGIGTAAPEAPLHVRGGGSMGGIVVTPDVTDTASQLVLCENTSASNGMYIRYNGTTNNIEFGGRAADVETAAHLTVNRDSGAVVIDPATAIGDNALVVPAASISALETGNEAGVASSLSTAAVNLPVQTSTTVDSITINAPTSGKVVVYATVQYSNPDSRDQIIRSIISTSSTASATTGYATNLRGFDVLGGNAFPECLTIHKTFTVSPGATTFFFRARPLNDAPVSFASPTADDIALTAMFFPTTY